MAKRRKPKTKLRPKRLPKPKLFRIREDKLRPLLREAARAGLVEAIEHCSNFWSVSDGYKRYIDHQVAEQSEALIAAVRAVMREKLARKRRRI